MPGACRLRLGRRGNVALITALLAVPLLGLTSLAVDFGNATVARARLDEAADSAALLATTVASDQFLAGSVAPAAAGQAAGVQRFAGQAGAMANVVVQPVSITVAQSGGVFNASVAYHGAYTTMLGAILGVGSIALDGASSSSQSVKPYVDIQVLMDVSSSMTIAATAAAQSAMQTLTAAYNPTGVLPGNVIRGEACAFACHWSTTGNDFLALARANGIQLRIDVLSAAVGNLIITIAALNTDSVFRLGLTTFAERFAQIYPVSGNIAGAAAALSQIGPDINDCSNNCPETYVPNAMASIAAITTPSGNGATQATSQKFLFVVSDGVIDQYTGNNRVIRPVAAADCAAAKAKGITILTLYTPYLPLMNNGFYLAYVWPYQNMPAPDQVQQGLMACASSPTLAFTATSASQIDAQLQAMLSAVLQTSGHLTQ